MLHNIQWYFFCFTIFGALGGIDLERNVQTLSGITTRRISFLHFSEAGQIACAILAIAFRPW